MNLGKRMKPSVEVSNAPIADIVFLLLIYFMLTSSFVVNRSLEVDLPQASAVSSEMGGNTVTITSDLQFAWNHDVVTREEIPERITKLLTDKNNDDRTITLKVDKAVTMEDVAFVMGAVAQHGGKVVLLAKP